MLFVSYTGATRNGQVDGWMLFSKTPMPSTKHDIEVIVGKIRQAENMTSCIPINFQMLPDPITTDTPENTSNTAGDNPK